MKTKRSAWEEILEQESPVFQSVLGGLTAGVAMGLLMRYGYGDIAMIGALVGQESVIVGWLVHLVVSIGFGLLFGAGLVYTSMRRYLGSPLAFVVLGVTYGIFIWLVGAGIVMPYWLSVMGAVSNPEIPLLTRESLLVHMLYGLVLGVVYIAVHSWAERERASVSSQL
jgi:hypothetical protein